MSGPSASSAARRWSNTTPRPAGRSPAGLRPQVRRRTGAGPPVRLSFVPARPARRHPHARSVPLPHGAVVFAEEGGRGIIYIGSKTTGRDATGAPACCAMVLDIEITGWGLGWQGTGA